MNRFLLVFVFVTWVNLGCRNDDVTVQEESQSCKLTGHVSDGKYPNKLTYDEFGRLASNVGERQFYSFAYEYDKDGFLIKAVPQSNSSQFRDYKYENGLLSELALSDKLFGTYMVHSFKYDSKKNLIRVESVFTNDGAEIRYFSDFKDNTLISYTIKSPFHKEKVFAFQNNNTVKEEMEYGGHKLYEFDLKHRLTAVREFNLDGSLQWRREISYAEGKSEMLAFQGFKGFPKIINNITQYSSPVGVMSSLASVSPENLLKSDIYYEVRNGAEIKTYEAVYSYDYNPKGFPAMRTINGGQLYLGKWEVNPMYITEYTYQDCE